mmetsp:Transcript_99249/g.236795  ORF Transcript_99249/g.236795 Transcript_99249/m.236795 type:complete len:200 (+) Transcript_99249:960-1559(+)
MLSAFAKRFWRKVVTSFCRRAFFCDVATAAWVAWSSCWFLSARAWRKLSDSLCTSSSRSSFFFLSCCSASSRSCSARKDASPSSLGDAPFSRALSMTARRHRDTASRKGVIALSRVLLGLRCSRPRFRNLAAATANSCSSRRVLVTSLPFKTSAGSKSMRFTPTAADAESAMYCKSSMRASLDCSGHSWDIACKKPVCC